MTRASRSISRTATMQAVLLGVAIALMTAGCTASTPPAERAAQAPQAAVAVTRMNPDQVRQMIASNFPAEVPVADGAIVSGEAQGENAWDYELSVEAPVETVVAWYQAEYELRSWRLGEKRVADGVTQLTLRKGGAESVVSVRQSPGNDTVSVVNVLLGVGAPVIETQ